MPATEVDPDLPETQIDEPAQEQAALVDMVEFEGKLYPRKHRPSWTLEQYLERELAITQDQLDRGVLRDQEVRGERTLARSERYLRWRYAGFVAGQVASL